MTQLKVHNAADQGELMRLKTDKLGRHYHRVPQYLREMLAKHPRLISDYFLRNFRINLEFTGVRVYEQPPRTAQCLYRCHYGKVGFAPDRGLVSEALENYYGGHYSPHHKPPESMSEQRLRNRMGKEVVSLFARALLAGQSFGELTLFDHTYADTRWECIAELQFVSAAAGEPVSMFIYLDEQLVDLLTERMAAPALAAEPVDLMEQVLALPVRLNCVVASVRLPLAEVSALAPGDIVPIRLSERCDVVIRQQKLFRGALIEDDGALFLTSLERAQHHD